MFSGNFERSWLADSSCKSQGAAAIWFRPIGVIESTRAILPLEALTSVCSSLARRKQCSYLRCNELTYQWICLCGA